MTEDKKDETRPQNENNVSQEDDWLESLVTDGIEDPFIEDDLDLIPDDLMPTEKKRDHFKAAADMSVAISKASTEIPTTLSINDSLTITGGSLPRFLLAISKHSDDYTLLLRGKSKTAVIDIIRGKILRITDRPLNPSTFLGVLLIRKKGMTKTTLDLATELMKKDGILQGEALLRIGAFPSEEIVKMLRAQAELRFSALFREPALQIKVFPPRLDRIPSLVFPWVSVIFNACWKEMSTRTLFDWADQYADHVLVKGMEQNPRNVGLSEGIENFWGQSIESKRSLSQINANVNISPSNGYRLLFALFRLGLVTIQTQEGQILDSGSMFHSQIQEETVTEPKEKSDAVDFDFDLDQMLDEQLPEIPEEPVTEKPVAKAKPVTSVETVATAEPEKSPQEIQKEKTPTITTEKDLQKAKQEKAKLMAMKKKRRLEEAKRRFNKGKDFFDRLQFKESIKFFRSAAKLDPKDNRFAAFAAFAEYILDKTPDTRQKAINAIKNGLDPSDDGVEHFLLLGIIYKFSEELPKSIACFNRVLEFNPDNTHALREIRLYNMARQKNGPTKSNGMFSKVFSKFSKK